MSVLASSREVKAEFDDYLTKVVEDGEPCVVQRERKNYAVLVSHNDWQRRELGRHLDALATSTASRTQHSGILKSYWQLKVSGASCRTNNANFVSSHKSSIESCCDVRRRWSNSREPSAIGAAGLRRSPRKVSVRVLPISKVSRTTVRSPAVSLSSLSPAVLCEVPEPGEAVVGIGVVLHDVEGEVVRAAEAPNAESEQERGSCGRMLGDE